MYTDQKHPEVCVEVNKNSCMCEWCGVDNDYEDGPWVVTFNWPHNCLYLCEECIPKARSFLVRMAHAINKNPSGIVGVM